MKSYLLGGYIRFLTELCLYMVQEISRPLQCSEKRQIADNDKLFFSGTVNLRNQTKDSKSSISNIDFKAGSVQIINLTIWKDTRCVKM